ncbi:transcription factor MAMYB-like [Phragmites australis]|uniref:transcription factor MAMYB-like n=1 Tax=Phragmites australis TaxID=29695 RepID=UPI002D773CF2|nr:transcription factor MAMYB-like [Phragmites australis]
MEFINDDWDSQPRARVVHSVTNSTSSSSSTSARTSPSLPHAASCAAAAVLLLAAAYYLPPAFQVLSSLLVWVAASLLLAPFAPLSSTGGDISVGRGRLLPSQEPPQEPTPDPAPAPRRGRRQNPTPPPPKPSDPITAPVQPAASPLPPREAAVVLDSGEREDDTGEWTDQELELLRRQMVKHPAGEPQRWEKIAAAFGGRRTPESVIRAAKSGAAAAAGGSFEQFLRKRKPLDPRAEAADVGANAGGGEGGDGAWSAGDDRALLNALKEFPKDTAMRWEKVAAAVPGKTKAACMKRVTELKRDFRSTKAASEAAS